MRGKIPDMFDSTIRNIKAKQARKVIEQIAQEKRERLKGGGADFQGALKRLVGIWSDPSHALIELLQNADDANATAVEYRMLPNGILFKHNGHIFTKDEVRAICSIDTSTKDAEKHTGFMGIGFKAVFKLSTSPLIFCPPWQFYFSQRESQPGDWGWILIPHWIDSLPAEVTKISDGTTVFWLPYKKDLSKEAIEQIEKSILERFDGLCLMFLRNVRRIQIATPEGIARQLYVEGDTVIEERDGEKISKRYKVLRKTFNIPKEVKTEYEVQDSGRDKAVVREIILAFALNSEGDLQRMYNSQLYTFFPTECHTDLRFAVQGDFILDTQRSHINKSLEWNRWLWRCVRALLIDSIEGFTDENGNYVQGFKEIGRMRYQFYRILPRREDFWRAAEMIKTELAEPFWSYCRDNPLILTSDDKWVKPSEAILATPVVQELLDQEKLADLKSRYHFVHPEVKEAKGFLKEIGVSKLEEHEMLKALEDKDWVASKDDDWFRRLYNFLWMGLYSDNRWEDSWRLRNKARDLPFIKTSQDVVMRAEAVLFPPIQEQETYTPRIPGIFFVDMALLDDNARRLMENLGVKPFNVENVIRTVILKAFKNGPGEQWDEEQLTECITLLRDWLRERKWDPPRNMRDDLKEVRIRTEDGNWGKAGECYLPKEDLKSLYRTANFAQLDEKDEEQQDFLLALGVHDKPRVLHTSERYDILYSSKGPDFTPDWSKYLDWLREDCSLPYSTWYRRISDISALDHWHEIEWHPQNAAIMLSYLVQHWNNYYEQHKTSQYEYFYYSDKTQYIPSYLEYQLRETKWLPTTKGLKKPSKEIFLPRKEIQRVAGDLVPYLILPDGCNEQEFFNQGREFFEEFLSLRTNLDIHTLKYLLEIVHEYDNVDDRIKRCLKEIYRSLGKLLLEDDIELWGRIKLLTEANTFKDSTDLYWKDDYDLGQYFRDIEKALFAWIPDNVERKFIEIFFQKTGVKALSEHTSRKLEKTETTKTPTLDETCTRWLRSKAKYIYSLFVHYSANKADISTKKLSEIKVKSHDALKLHVNLDDISERAVGVPVFYDEDNNTLHRTHEATNFDIALELARAFGLKPEYVDSLETLLHKHKREEIERKFQRQGIPLLDLNRTRESSSSEPPAIYEPSSEQPPALSESLSTEPPARYEPLSKQPSTSPEPSSSKPPITYELPSKRPPTSPSGGGGSQTTEIEILNIQRIIEFEKDQGRNARDVSRDHLGYDIKSTDPKTGEFRYIELKSSSRVELTPHEYDVAQREGPNYYIYVIDGNNLYVIKDPSHSSEITRDIVERFKIIRWWEAGQKYSLPNIYSEY